MKFPREQIEPEWVISVKYLKDLKSKIENQIPIKYISDLDLEDIEAVLLALEIADNPSRTKMSDLELTKKPCPYPYCRSENIAVMHSESFHSDHPETSIRYNVQCKDCGTRGPKSQDELFAMQGWNDLPRSEPT